jgi:lipid-A-disaccharide synthase-like uncharacterized protein
MLCPSSRDVLFAVFWKLLVLIGVLNLGYYIMERFSIDIDTLANMGIRAKIKILVSFYQIISSLQTAHGANLYDKLKIWTS